MSAVVGDLAVPVAVFPAARPPARIAGFAVLTDEAGLPVTLLAAGGEGAWPPAVLLPAGLPLRTLFDLGADLLMRLNPYGGVVMDGGAIIGMAGHEAVDAHLPLGRRRRAREAHPADSDLYGGLQPVSARVRCARCGHLNTLVFYDPGRPPACAGEGPAHVLAIPGAE